MSTVPPERPDPLVGLLVIRGGGTATQPRRLPRRAPATLGRRERHAVELVPEWLPRDLVSFTPVEEGWLAANPTRLRMQVESDWLQGGAATFLPGAVVMAQRGDHRFTWPELGRPFGVSLTVRTRRLEDQRVGYVVDSAVEPGGPSAAGSVDVPLSAGLRYRLAVLFRHLLEQQPPPPQLVTRRAAFLGTTEEALLEAAHRCRRRLNAVRRTDLQSLEDLGDYLVSSGDLTRRDLDP